jgi:hypothetical protein
MEEWRCRICLSPPAGEPRLLVDGLQIKALTSGRRLYRLFGRISQTGLDMHHTCFVRITKTSAASVAIETIRTTPGSGDRCSL